MKKPFLFSSDFICGIVLTSIFTLWSVRVEGQSDTPWHHPLYLSNMGYWHSRIPVVITNFSKQNVTGHTLKIKIGKEKGQLPLAGINASELRVVESGGTELLWRVISPDNKILTEGSIPGNSEFVFPVTVHSGKSETCYIYYDNTASWPVGAILEEGRYGRKEGEKSDLPKNDNLYVIIKPVQNISLSEKGRNEDWPADGKWDVRVPIKVFNFGKSKSESLPVYVKMEQVYLRLHDKDVQNSPTQLGSTNNKSFFSFENAILFESSIEASSEQTTYAYFMSGEKKDRNYYQKKFSDWCADNRNLLLSLPQGGDISREGLTQDIAIMQGRTFMLGAMVRCRDSTNEISVRVRFHGKDGNPVNVHTFSDRVTATSDWKFFSVVFLAPEKASYARVSFNLEYSGSVNYEGILMMEVFEGYASSMFFEQRQADNLKKLTLWPVNPVVKVFQEDLPPLQVEPLRISVAKNETEPLQIALRSPEDSRNMRFEVTEPVNSAGQKLDQVTVNLVGYVPIDYPSNYYEKKVPYWYLKYPTEPIGSDGWSGFWPDPLLPVRTFDLKANTTQLIWIEVTVPGEALSGDYTGLIKLFRNSVLVNEMPWTVHVWNFTLPVRNTFGALYDYRSVHRMPETGPDLVNKDISRSDLQNMHLSMMAKHRISSGEIIPVPKVEYDSGKVNIDFTEYDKAASYYFDQLKNPFAYLPVNIFYLFGWAFPPSEKFNENPYPGEYPYKDANRSKLRPEYKKAYQLVLKTFWDHLKEKGWSDRYILYLSDEPHEADNNINSNNIKFQMKALCDMVHEVDPKIPVYVSTWWYRPEWESYIDVWGLGFNGEGDYGHNVTEDDFRRITKSGGRIMYTTDGNFCTETPYMALERLLPWFGFKYGAEAYEFWGVNWLTYNPYKYGWHSYIYESQAPGEESWKRYPNGDGYIIYPGKPINYEGLVGSIRLKQVREGAEDYEYFTLLNSLIKKSDPDNHHLKTGIKALKQATDLVNIPCAMGRYSTKILKSPDEVLRIREKVAESIEALINE